MNEIGRRLKVEELRIKTVVCVSREDRPHMFTVWVAEIEEAFVVFHAGGRTLPISLIVARLPGGKLVDDTGKEIVTYEYLGEI